MLWTRAKEKRRYKWERAKERLRYEELVRELMTGKPRCVEVGPESLKLTKLLEINNIEYWSVSDNFWVSSRSSWSRTRQESSDSGLPSDREGTAGLCSNEQWGRLWLWPSEGCHFSTLWYQRGNLPLTIPDGKAKREWDTCGICHSSLRLAEKWLKNCGERQAVIDTVVKEQFVEVLPDIVRIWIKERKPRSSEKAGKLAEGYRQAGKAELWSSTSFKEEWKVCYLCGQVGDLAKDCLVKPTALSMSENKGEKKKKRSFLCVMYNCGRRGHTSQQCPSSALFCEVRGFTTI